MKIADRTFIVSGGSSGLGLATAQMLLQHGANVGILDTQPPPPLSPLSPLASGSAAQCRFARADVRDAQEVREAVDEMARWAVETGLRLGGVVNCAGIGLLDLTINARGEPHSTEIWDRTIGINLTGTFNVTRFAVRHLVDVEPEDTEDAERGVVIFVSSEAAFEGHPGQIAYAASKGALRSMTLPMARDLARHHVRVACIAPGPFTTPLTDRFPRKVKRQILGDAIGRGSGEARVGGGLLYPRRYGRAEEFAETVRWIVECGYVNGEVVRLTAGARIPAPL